MTQPKQKIMGGVRQKPHVRKFNRKTAVIGIAATVASLAAVFALDPMKWLSGLKPEPAVRERIEPPAQDLVLEGLPTDYSNNGQPSSVVQTATLAPAEKPPIDMGELPDPNKSAPAGFPKPENSQAAAGNAKGPKMVRKALGFSGDDPFDELTKAQKLQPEGQTPYSGVQMAAAGQSQESAGASKADKFRNQNSGKANSMFLDSQPISATARPGYGQITPGTIIQAKLASATNSELGGSVVAKVSADVYDKATGQCLMIDRKNSEIFGKLSDQVDYGQSRQQAVWKSIHTPKMHLDIGGMDATDAAGRTGIESETNRHYGRLTVAAIGATALDVLSSWAQGSKNNGTEINIGGSFANNAGSIGQQIIQRELQVKDELEQIIGMPVSLMVDRIIELPCLNRS